MSDVLKHISSFLPPEHLVILSMVNRYTKQYADVQLSDSFAETVNFCLRRYLFHCPDHMRMTLNTNSGILEGEYNVQSFAEVWKLFALTTFKSGNSLKMKLAFHVSHEYVRFTSNDSQRILPIPDKFKLDNITFVIVINKWKIRAKSWKALPGPEGVGLVYAGHIGLVAQCIQCRLSSIPSECYDLWGESHPRIQLTVPMQMFLGINPIFMRAWSCYMAGFQCSPHEISMIQQYQAMLLPRLTMRELAVCRSIKICMHCHQRSYHYSSLQVSDPSHRRLCRVCWGLLYVKTNVLTNTHKLHCSPHVKQRLEQHVSKILFREDDYCDGLFHTAYHKTELALGLGYESWDEFIRQNYLHPQPFSRMKARGIYRYHFNRTAFSEAL